jgi:alkylation response protein AidB-like acyl-CoA dehydrogenase
MIARRSGLMDVSMSGAASSSFIEVAKALAPRIQAFTDESEQTRRLPVAVVEAIAQAGFFRLWIPRSMGGEETDPITLVQVVEQVSRVDGAMGWCVALGGSYGIFGGYLPADAARKIYGGDPYVVTAGAFRPFGRAVVVDGGYSVTGRWPLGSGCQHSAWIVGGCQILVGDQPRLGPSGMPVTRIMFFPAAE